MDKEQHAFTSLASSIAAIGCVVSLGVAANPAIAEPLEAWKYDPITNQLEFVLTDGVQPRHFLMAQPARIVVDLPDTQMGNVPPQQTFEQGAIRQITVMQLQPQLTRVILEMSPDAVFARGQVQIQRMGDGDRSLSDRWMIQPLLAQASSPPPVASVPAAANPVANPSVSASVSASSPAIDSNLPRFNRTTEVAAPPSPTEFPPGMATVILPTATPAINSTPIETTTSTPIPIAVPQPRPDLPKTIATVPSNPSPAKPSNSSPVVFQPAQPVLTQPAQPSLNRSSEVVAPPSPAEFPPGMEAAIVPDTSPKASPSNPPSNPPIEAAQLSTRQPSPVTSAPPTNPLAIVPNPIAASPIDSKPAQPPVETIEIPVPAPKTTAIAPATPAKTEAPQSGTPQPPAALPTITLPPAIAAAPNKPESNLKLPDELPGVPTSLPPSGLAAPSLSVPSVSVPPVPSLANPAVSSAVPPSGIALPMSVVPTVQPQMQPQLTSRPQAATIAQPGEIIPGVPLPAKPPTILASVIQTPIPATAPVVAETGLRTTPSTIPSITPSSTTIEFGQAIPGSSPAAPQVNSQAAPSTVAAIATPAGTLVLPTGTTLSLRYTGIDRLTLQGNQPRQEMLVLQSPIVDGAGNIIAPEGSVVLGRFETIGDKSRFVAQTLSLQGRNIPIGAESTELGATRKLSERQMLQNSGLGALAGIIVGGLSGGNFIGGAAAGAAITYATTPKSTAIEPGQTLEIRLTQDLVIPAGFSNQQALAR